MFIGDPSITLPPQLQRTISEGPECAALEAENTAYWQRCPFCDAVVTQWLVMETFIDDPSPSYVDARGYQHWHDASRITRIWLCECGHIWVEQEVGAPCWCGWPFRETDTTVTTQ